MVDLLIKDVTSSSQQNLKHLAWKVDMFLISYIDIYCFNYINNGFLIISIAVKEKTNS